MKAARHPPEPFYKGIMATPDDFEPSSDRMKTIGTFNAGATVVSDEHGEDVTLLMIRKAEMPVEPPGDMVPLPYFDVKNSPDSLFCIEFDWEPADAVEIEHGHVKLKSSGLNRLRHISYPIKAISRNGLTIDWKEETPGFYPCFEHERFGIEDVRITKIGKTYVFTYISPHRMFGVSTSVAITKDFSSYTRLPVAETPKHIFTSMKDVAFFPSFVKHNTGKKYVSLIRPSAFPDMCKPGIWVSFSSDMEYWGDDRRVKTSENGEISGAGAPPVEIDGMWVAPFHEVLEYTENGREHRRYYGRLMGLDLMNPHRLLYTSGILMKPGEFDIEPGFMPGVVYPTGFIVRDGVADIYSGEDDTYLSVRRYYLEDLVKFLKASE